MRTDKYNRDLIGGDRGTGICEFTGKESFFLQKSRNFIFLNEHDLSKISFLSGIWKYPYSIVTM